LTTTATTTVDEFGITLVIRSRRRSRPPGSAVARHVLSSYPGITPSAGMGAHTAGHIGHHQDFRVALRQPGRWCGGRRAENGGDAGLAQFLHDEVQLVEIVVALLRFHALPGEFRHAHDVHASLEHPLDIGVNLF